MIPISYDILSVLNGKTVSTAESCTGGGIGAALTSVSGISKVYKGGVVTYTDEMKSDLLKIDRKLIGEYGAVSEQVAEAMARNVRALLHTDIGISVTGLAGPDGDDRGNEVGTVFLGYADDKKIVVREFHFLGDRDSVRREAVIHSLKLIQDMNK